MSTNHEHENAETRRQERREHDKENYRREGDEMRQGGPDPNLQHHDRKRAGEGFYSPDSTADTGSSDGVASVVSVVSGDGGNTPGRHAELNPDTTSPNQDQGGTKGAASSREPNLRTPSAQTAHTAKGPRGDGGQGKAGGSKSGKQSQPIELTSHVRNSNVGRQPAECASAAA